jgi:ribosomal protein L23
VRTSATKPQIAQAIRELYGVEVVKVRTIMNQAEQRKTGRKRLRASTAKSKRALVSLQDGQTIAIFDIGK